METAVTLVITQLSGYLSGLTQRLDPGTGWYGEFLRRDPEGLRACLDGAVMPPWDVVESLLDDLARARGAEFAARETQYAARLRAEAAAAWDRLPGGAAELRALISAAAEQREAAEAAARVLTARLAATADRAEAHAVAGELAWLRDDAARAASRHEDLTTRLAALTGPDPLPAVPRQRADTPAAPPVEPPGRAADAADAPRGGSADRQPHERPGASWGASGERDPYGGSSAGSGRASGGEATDGYGGRVSGGAGGSAGHPGDPRGVAEQPSGAPAAEAQRGYAGRESREGPGPAPGAAVPDRARRAEGRRLRGGAARRGGGARYAGSAAPEPTPFVPPPGHPAGPTAAPPRGARFGSPEPQPHDAGAGDGPSGGRPESGPGVHGVGAGLPREGRVQDTVAELITLRAQGRSGEAHVLLCEAASWPPALLPDLAAELARAGLGADWATLLWEAASLPPERLAAAAAALGAAGRHADCEALLRQGVSRPAAEIAEAAVALAGAGRPGEADAVLGAFVRARTAEESARLARRDPQWFVPRLLRAAEAVSDGCHRDLVHALRVAKLLTSRTS
ncbi:hypothetical protein ACFV7Q_10660 [Streptomyces sp. NPDC059851]|uniref:hypothetical protein n=1 Tax=Streptomyces sp. NPDC059851 TaxID=3346971 RepID=UPI00365EED12